MAKQFDQYGREVKKPKAPLGGQSQVNIKFREDLLRKEQEDNLARAEKEKRESFETESQRIMGAQVGARFNPMQSGLAKRLEQQSMGQGPSIADAQMRAAMERSLAGQQASIASNRGINPGLAQTLMARQGAAQRAELGQASGIARLQEQQMAQSQLQGSLDAQTQAEQFYDQQLAQNFLAMKGADQANAQLQAQERQAREAGRAARRGQDMAILGGLGQAAATYYGGGAK